MFVQIGALIVLVSAVSAGVPVWGGIGVASDVGHGVVDLHTPAKYEFNYGVKDPKTGDNKEQSEVRVGDVVKGQYSVAEPDGTIRVVKYTADDHNGFNAVVSRVGHAAHPVVVKKVVPVVSHSVPLVSHAVPVVSHGVLGGLGGIGGIGLGGLGGGLLGDGGAGLLGGHGY